MKKFLVFIATIVLTITCCFSQHSIVLKSGKKIKGIVLELKHDTLYYAASQEMSKVHMMEVSSLFFDEFVAYDGTLMDSEPEKSITSGKYLIKYRMHERDMIKAPIISNGTQQKGVVVVDVTINRSGRVINAKAGAIGTTTTSDYLLTKAKFAAQGAIFSKHDTAPIEVDGTITITY